MFLHTFVCLFETGSFTGLGFAKEARLAGLPMLELLACHHHHHHAWLFLMWVLGLELKSCVGKINTLLTASFVLTCLGVLQYLAQ